MFNYLSFGYIPSGDKMQDVIGRFRGHPNLAKRLQAKKIMDVIKVKGGDRILDFGCGLGFFTYEFSKRGADSYGVDLITFPNHYLVGKRFHFFTVKPDSNLPFGDSFFDKVFVSEVIITLDDPDSRLKELNRVLKRGGEIIIVNTLGRRVIEDAFQYNSFFLKFLLKLYPKSPKNYREFCGAFFSNDNLDRTRWFTVEQLSQLLKNTNFTATEVFYPFKNAAFALISWIQFIRICNNKKIYLNFNTIAYLFLEFLNSISWQRDLSNVIITARKS